MDTNQILNIILGGGAATLVTWIISLKTQLRKLKNDGINSDSDTTDKSLEVSMKLIKTNEMLQEKVGIMMAQVAAIAEELSEVKAKLAASNKQLVDFAEECTCGAGKKLILP